MSSSRTSSKRKRQEGGNDSESSSDGVMETVFRGWVDEGIPRPDGTIDHEAFSISLGADLFEINLGDIVLMRSPDEQSSDYNDSIDYYGSNKAGDDMMIARVERIYEERKARGSKNESHDSSYKFRARWFFKVCIFVTQKWLGFVSRRPAVSHIPVTFCRRKM